MSRDQSATSIQSLLNTNGAIFLMTSHVRSTLWTLFFFSFIKSNVFDDQGKSKYKSNQKSICLHWFFSKTSKLHHFLQFERKDINRYANSLLNRDASKHQGHTMILPVAKKIRLLKDLWWNGRSPTWNFKKVSFDKKFAAGFSTHHRIL